MSLSTYFSGNPLNRLSYLRPSQAFLTSALRSPKSQFLLYDSLSPLSTSVSKSGEKHLHLLSWKDVQESIGDPEKVFVGVDGKDIESLMFVPEKDGKELSQQEKIEWFTSRPALVFLGVDERSAPESAKSLPLSKPTSSSTLETHSPHGIPYWALDVTHNAELKKSALAQKEGLEFSDLRAGMTVIPGEEAAIAAVGRAMVDWNTRNVYCTSCTRPLKQCWAGWKRVCVPIEKETTPCLSKKGVNNYSYPRTDPVVIMGVVSEDGESILLGRQKSWPRGFYSALAGFIEAGETFEEAVAREVYEEAGVEVQDVKFVANQVWPYPSSLMMGGLATVKPNQTIRLDLDNELEDARYFTRTEVLNVINSTQRTHLTREEIAKIDGNGTRSRTPSPGRGERPAFRMPPSTAIANTLITAWAQGNVDGSLSVKEGEKGGKL